jgi:hypothetical protein
MNNVDVSHGRQHVGFHGSRERGADDDKEVDYDIDGEAQTMTLSVDVAGFMPVELQSGSPPVEVLGRVTKGNGMMCDTNAHANQVNFLAAHLWSYGRRIYRLRAMRDNGVGRRRGVSVAAPPGIDQLHY